MAGFFEAEDEGLGRGDDPADDGAMRQLRRRYDLLRRDYEDLIDRLGELEERLQTRPRPQAASAAGLSEILLRPLVHLRDDYEALLGELQTIVAALSSVATGAMKGQRGADGGRRPQPVRAAPQHPAHERPQPVQVEVAGHGFGRLLEFQERIAKIEGVVRVSINAIDNDRATIVVELGGKDSSE